jgi:hypothetical protein
MGEGKIMYRFVVGKPKGKSPLRRPKRRWENNIKADLQEVRCGGMGLVSWLSIETVGWRL